MAKLQSHLDLKTEGLMKESPGGFPLQDHGVSFI